MPAPPVELPQGPEKTARVRAMFDAIAPRYELVNRCITLGMDQEWRRRTVRALRVPAGSVVLDLACGTGDLSRILERQGLRCLGADLSWGMLEENATGVPLVQSDVAALPLATASMDGVVCGYGLRNFTDLGVAFAELARVVRPGGRISFLEVAAPLSPVLRAGFRVWFQEVVPRLGGLLSDAEAYRYLPRSTAYLPAPRDLRAMLVATGFSGVGRQLLAGGLSQIVHATRVS